MDALTLAAFAGLFCTLTAFVGYWAGVGRTERAWRDRETQLLDDLDDLTVLLTEMAARPTHPAGRHLRLVEEA